ncbi:formimidoylglutamase [Belliella sp. R4-6]|uniref:Formimidoylglutamase n=1 Tax=Belliella alkalica TaxID=1730871 RepID=A0ABS9V8U5_9BACT|nr:formimidoylglutamase [Belliella alkalica]MCH7412375.1 formimidoylglutamase [Belliella alkalica]
MKNHKSTAQYNWKGRPSETIQYWHQQVRCIDDLSFQDINPKKKIGLLGYAVDEGVRRNQGRVGAIAGPDSIRKVMGPMAYHLPENLNILDYGDIFGEGSSLEELQKSTEENITKLLERNHFPIILGGGHDLAFPHGMAALQYTANKNETLGIINLDAHFDLRELNNGQGHSGSPFLQILNSAKTQNKKCEYLCLGIQRAANPSSLFETAKTTGSWWMESEDCTVENWSSVKNTLDSFLSKVNKIYLSIDLDGFSSAFAPGVSAPSPMGFSPDFALKVLEYLAKSKKLLTMDVVELNPAYDIDHSTAKLAARCIEFTLRKLWE